MNLISLTQQFYVDVDCTRDQLDELSDAIADALYDLERSTAFKSALLDSTVSADLGEHLIDINVTIQHIDEDMGVAVGHSAISTALKKAVEVVNGKLSAEESMTSTAEKAELLAV